MKQNMLFSFGNGEEVIKGLERMMDESHGKADVREWCLLIEAYDHQEQYEKALCVIREAMQKYPDNWELHYLAGMVYCSMENYEKAIEYYKKSRPIGNAFL